MRKALATLLLCLAALALGGCADRGKDSRPGPTSSPSSGTSSGQDNNTKLENCVTAVGADRDNCKAK
jgi:hypothetical protein